jgi:leucyl/phenylalanyl-tRNA--protein transferase
MSATPKFRFIRFPDTRNCNPEGLLASGGELSPDMLLSAYSQGIFPWFSEDQPILWWSPTPRMVLYPNELKISRSMRKVLRNRGFTFTANEAFSQVIELCSSQRINETRQASSEQAATQNDTWITSDMKTAYTKLHELGFAHSIEVWDSDDLVGGLYGIALGKVFFGESMFSKVSNASKSAFIMLTRHLSSQSYELIDCQVSNPHLVSLGANEISREKFEQYLDYSCFDQPEPNFSEKFETFISNNAIS